MLVFYMYMLLLRLIWLVSGDFEFVDIKKVLY